MHWAFHAMNTLDKKIQKKFDWIVISNFIEKNRLENVVELKGFLNQDQIKYYYYTAHLFLLPSLIDPNPLSVVEALWSSLPIMISSNCGNSFESVVEERNGWILNLSDPESIVDSWTMFVKSDSDKLKKMGRESLKIANKYFASNREIQNLIKALKNDYGS
jgi:glycosyltransferase involved in cell wall biosynthesis